MVDDEVLDRIVEQYVGTDAPLAVADNKLRWGSQFANIEKISEKVGEDLTEDDKEPLKEKV